MKLFSIMILDKGTHTAHCLKVVYDLSSFGYFKRGTIQDFINMTSRLLVERTQIGQRQSVKEKEYICHVFVRNDNLAAVCFSDEEYPQKVIHTILTKILEDFTILIPSIPPFVARHFWPEPKKIKDFDGVLENYLKKYQNPSEADVMMKLQAEIDETKIILHRTMEDLLGRGEKLDDLVEKSAYLKDSSKFFYKTAKKTNSCCGI